MFWVSLPLMGASVAQALLPVLADQQGEPRHSQEWLCY